MKDPCRLRDQDNGPLASALLRVGSSYRSSAQARARTLAALGLLGSTALSTSMASATFFAKVGWAKLTAGMVAAAVAVPVAYYAWSDEAPSEQSVPALPKAAPAAQQTQETAEPAPAPTLDAEEVPPEPAAAPSTPKKSGASKRSAAAEQASASALLTAELEALDAARSALANGNAARARRLLGDYARQYPRGRLGLEAEVLRIDALARSGQKAAAQARARAFLRRRPNSVLASRVRAHLGE